MLSLAALINSRSKGDVEMTIRTRVGGLRGQCRGCFHLIVRCLSCHVYLTALPATSTCGAVCSSNLLEHLQFAASGEVFYLGPLVHSRNGNWRRVAATAEAFCSALGNVDRSDNLYAWQLACSNKGAGMAGATE